MQHFPRRWFPAAAMCPWLLLLLLLLLLAARPADSSSLEADVCAAPTYLPVELGPAGAAVRLPVLAALRRPGTDGFGCSQLVEDAWPSIKALEWAFDLLNKDSGTEDGVAINDSYIPGVKFVLSVQDTCGRRQVTDSLIDRIFPDLVSTSASCAVNQTLVPGVIGPQDGASAMSMAPLLNDFGIPMVSFGAVQSALSDRSAYPNFFRTIPSELAQIDAIGAVLQQYKWTHIGILYTSDSYGTAGYSALVRLSASIGVCVAEATAIGTSPTPAEVSTALGRLRDSGVRAVVAIASLSDFSVLFNDPASTSFQWVMSDSFGNPASLLSVKNARGLTSVTLGHRLNDVFERYWLSQLSGIASSGNPAFQQWYMQTYNCRLAGMTNDANPAAPVCPPFDSAAATAQYQQNRLVEPAIDAAFTYARALKQLWQSKCSGVRGVCSALRNSSYQELRAAIASTDFSYTAAERITRYSTASVEPDRRVKQLRLTSTGDPYETNFFVHNLRTNDSAFAYVRVGVRIAGSFAQWLPGSVNVYDQARDTVISLPQLGCPATPCARCLATPPDFKYAHVPGDVYLLGVFSVHSPGATPSSCGSVNPTGSSELDAFLYSVRQANTLVNASSVSGLSTPLLVGAVAVDDCGSSVLAQDLVDSLLSGTRSIPGVDSARIVGIVGAGGSATTDSVAQLLALQRRSQVSYRPVVLSSSPYLYQTVAPASAEVAALISTLNSLSVNYVQMVCSIDAANREAARLFLAAARSQRICVSATYELGVNGTHASVMTQVKSRPAAATVVALVTDRDAALLLPHVTPPFQFLGGAGWGSSQSILTGSSAGPSVGAVTVGQPMSVTPYQAWSMQTRQLANETSGNPWYSEWYEALHQCSLSPTNMRAYTTLCTGADSHNLTASPRYTESAYTASVQRATAAYAMAVASRLRRSCNGTGSGVCSAFWYSGAGLQADLVAQFGSENFTDLAGGMFAFASRSVEDLGLSLYNIQNSSTAFGASYQTVGGTRPSFSLRTDLLRLAHGATAVASSCSDVSRCSECAPYFTGTPSYLYLPGDILVGVLVNVRSPGTSGGACGNVKTSEGFAYTEAVRWTINYINAGSKSDVRLGGSVKLGALILDSCGSSSVAISLVTSISQGTLVLTDKSTGANIDASKIRSWISYGDSVTVSLAPILRNLGGVPLISPSASSDDLTALSVFRTVPTNLDQVAGIIEIIKGFSWKCVQLVYSNNDYGTNMATQFRVQALSSGICVPRCLQVGTDGSVASILTSIKGDIARTRVVVVLSNNAVELLQLTAADDGLIFIASNFWGEMVNDTSLSGLGPGANNSWVIQANSPNVAPITDYLSGLSVGSSTDNPWITQYYEALFNCSTSGSLAYSTRCNNSWPVGASSQFYPGLFVMTTTNALFSVGRAYAEMLSVLCNSSYTTVCPSFWSDARLNAQLIDKLAAVSFSSMLGATFQYRSGRDGNMGWLALNKVGSNYVPTARYMLGALTHLPAYSSRSPFYNSVPATCTDCTNCPKSLDRTEKFLHVPGQLLIGGLFDIHNAGSVPFSCGTVNGQNGFLLTEVFKYAIESIPSSPIFAGKLRGVTIGGLAFDTCSSNVRTNALVSNFHSGAMVLRDSALARIDPENVMAYVAASTSEAASQISRVTDVIQSPVVSYAATMSSLSNKEIYPYFSRTVPSDDKVAFAIVDFLKRYGLNNVQFVLSPGVYGTSGLQSVQRAIVSEGVCISNTLEVNRTGLTSVNADQIASELLKRPQATVVVAFLEYADLVELLGAVSRNNQTANRFLFIGTTSWGNSKTVLSKITNGRYPKAITFGFETADLTDFERTYLLPKNPSSYGSVNPWFNEFYEYLFQCTLSSSSPYYSRTCSSSSMALTDSPNYSQDSLALYVVNAVYSTALGIHNALMRICGPSYNGICSDFSGSGEKRQWVLSGIRTSVFVDATSQNFTIDSRGDSNRGYHIYELKTVMSLPIYTSVGSYNDTSLLKLRSDFRIDWTSNCSLPGACDTVCPELGRNRSVYMQVNSSTMDLNLVQFLSVHSGLSASQCGPMNLQSGFNHLLAFYYALDLINNNTDTAVSGFKFGGLSIDVCSSEARASTFAFSYAAGNGICSYAAFSDLVLPLTAVAYVTDGSAVSERVASISPDGTVVSPDATAISLSSKVAYPRFLRVVPPDSVQIEALLDIASSFNWSIVSLIHDNTAFGLAGKAAFEAAVARRNGSSGVCIKYHGATSGTAITLPEAKAALQAASRAAYINALIVYLPEPGIRVLLTAIRELGMQGRFVLMGLDTWADKMTVVQGLETAALGAITLRQRYFTVADLDRWVSEIGLAPSRRKGIPVDWLEEFWQHTMKCRLTGSSVMQTQYAAVCDSTASLPTGALMQTAGTYSTIIAAFVAAKGIADFHRAECGTVATDVCLYRMSQTQRLATIYKYISNAQWQVLEGRLGNNSLLFRFTADGYGDRGYDVLNFVRSGSGFVYNRIGYWNQRFQPQAGESLTTYGPDGGPLAATPSSACPTGVDCGCPGNANDTLSGLPRPDVWERARTPWGAVLLALTTAGAAAAIVSLLFLALAFPRKQQGTAGTNYLGYACLIGVLLLFAINVAFIAHATPVVCTIRRFGLSLTYSIVYSSLLVRSAVYWSLNRADSGLSFAGLSHPASLLGLAICMCLVSAGLGAEWLILQRPDPTELVAYEGVAWSRCRPSDFYDEGLALSCLYPACLLLAAVVYSLLCWDAPLADSRLVVLALIFCAGGQLCWGCVSTLTGLKWRDPAVFVANLVAAAAVLFCLFVRKAAQLCRAGRQEAAAASSQEQAVGRDGPEYENHKELNLYNLDTLEGQKL